MAELVFYYGTMSSSKTANALMTRFQYIERGFGVWLVKPEVDTRDDVEIDGKRVAVIKSRVGVSAQADVIETGKSFHDLYTAYLKENEPPELIIVDEAQFLTENQIDELKGITEYLNIPVYCYGLRTDFTTHLFPGSKRLFELASKVIELPSVCDCGEPAIINGKFRRRKLVLSGDQVDIGGDDKYKPLCYKCYKQLKAEAEKRG